MHAINPPRCARPPLRKWERAFIDEVFSPHFVLPTVLTPGWPRSLEGARKLFTTMLAAAPDVQGTIEDMVAEGEKVAVRGPFAGRTPESRRSRVPRSGRRLRSWPCRSTGSRMARSRKTGVWTRNGRPERSGSDGAVAKAKGIQYGIALFRLGWDPSQAHNERKR